MTERTPFRIKCDSVAYRKGFIEVTPGIHDSCINIETWDIEADTSLANASWVDDSTIPESSVLANTELELTAEQARDLATALLAAADSVEQQ